MNNYGSFSPKGRKAIFLTPCGACDIISAKQWCDEKQGVVKTIWKNAFKNTVISMH